MTFPDAQGSSGRGGGPPPCGPGAWGAVVVTGVQGAALCRVPGSREGQPQRQAQRVDLDGDEIHLALHLGKVKS